MVPVNVTVPFPGSLSVPQLTAKGGYKQADHPLWTRADTRVGAGSCQFMHLKMGINPLPTNDATMRHDLSELSISLWGFIWGVYTRRYTSVRTCFLLILAVSYGR